MKQLTEDDLKSMTAEQIVEAQEQGRCANLLGQPVIPATGQLTDKHITAMKQMANGHELIAQAHEQGRFNNLLGRQVDGTFDGITEGAEQ